MRRDHEPIVLLTVLNVPLMLEASDVTTPMMATTIRPNITAYSTAVGPSSLVRKRRILETNTGMLSSLSERLGGP
jgi:hypothetical protein